MIGVLLGYGFLMIALAVAVGHAYARQQEAFMLRRSLRAKEAEVETLLDRLQSVSLTDYKVATGAYEFPAVPAGFYHADDTGLIADFKSAE